MAGLLTRIWKQQTIGYAPQSSVDGKTWTRLKTGTATSSGASDGTTVIDTNGDSGGANTLNGQYWVKILAGLCTGQMKRVVDDDGSGTLTIEGNGFSAQITSGIQYEIWFSPDPVVNVTSSSGATDMVDTTRTEADDFWIGYWAVVISGTRRGQKAQVTDFTSSGGVFVLDTGLAGALSAGDVVALRKFVEGTVTLPADIAYYPRSSNRNNFSMGDGVPGPRGGQMVLTTDCLPTASLSGAGAATRSVLNGLWQACGFVEVQGSTAQVGAGSSTSAVKVATGSHEGYVPGSMVIWNGTPAWVTSTEDGGGSVDTVNVTPPFPVIPASGGTLYATCMYRKSLNGDTYPVTIEVEVDGYRVIATGCVGNVVLQPGTPPKLIWTFNVDHFTVEVEAAPYLTGTTYTSAVPALESDRTCYLNTTKTNVGAVTASLNAEWSPLNVNGSEGINGRAGFSVVDLSKAGASMRELLSAADTALPQHELFMNRVAKDLIVYMGSHGRVVAFRMPVANLVEAALAEEQDGQASVRTVWAAHDAGTTTDGSGAVVKVPDFAFFIS